MSSMTEAGQVALTGWIHDILIWGGANLGSTKRYERDDQGNPILDKFGRPQLYLYEEDGMGLMYKSGDAEGATAAKKIYNAMLNRFSFYASENGRVGMIELDDALETLTRFSWWSLDGNKTFNRNGNFSVDTLAKFIAVFCKERDLLWKLGKKGSAISWAEFEEIKNYTHLGKALWENECFFYQKEQLEQDETAKENTTPEQTDNSTMTQTQSTGSAASIGNSGNIGNNNVSGSTGTGASKTGKNKSIAGVKSSLKGMSSLLPNLVSTQKESFTPAFYLQADKATITNKKTGLQGPEVNVPTVFITPLYDFSKLKNASQNSQLPMRSKADAMKVKLSGGNGGQDCWLFWKTQADADAFLQKCLAAGLDVNAKPPRQNLHVVQWSKTYEYFKVDTEFGEAYIRADKLNEALEEAYDKGFSVEEEEIPDVYNESLNSYIDSWQRAFDNFD